MKITLDPKQMNFLIAKISRLHYHRAHELLEKLGIYRGQPPLLEILLEQDGLKQSELADKLDITPATITKMLQRMEKSGFVLRQPDTNDQRISRVYLTDKGRAMKNELDAFKQQMTNEVFTGFNAEELELLNSYLLRLHQNLEKVTQKNNI